MTALMALAAVAMMPAAAAAAGTSPLTFLAGSGGENLATASDTNDCSAYLTPCATLDGALAQTSPGGTIVVSGDVNQVAATIVDQNVSIEQDTTPGASRAILNGLVGDTNGLIDITNSSIVRITGIAFDDGGGSGDFGGAITNNSGGSVTVTGSTFNNNISNDGAAIDNGDAGSGTAIVDDSTFNQGTADADGGAIDNGDNGGSGTLTVSDSGFGQSFASVDGGAIDNGDNGGSGTATVDGSTFSSGNVGQDGGAIDNGGTGLLTLTRSTFDGNDATENGGAVDTADSGGSGNLTAVSVTFADGRSNDGSDNSQSIANDAASNAQSATVNVASDLFAGSCVGAATSGWHDDGFNASVESSCLGTPPSARPDAAPNAAAGDLEPLADNGGSTATMELEADNPAVHVIPVSAQRFTVPAPNQNGSVGQGCPLANDQRFGNANDTTLGCDAGAVQLATAAVVYLAGEGSNGGSGADDLNDCSSPQTPCATLTGALAQAATGGTIDVSGTIEASQATPVDSNVTIQQSPLAGAAPAALTGTSGDTTGLISVSSGANVTIQDITFSHGTNDTSGGAISSTGSLTVSGSSFVANATTDGQGGAISSGPGLDVSASTFTANSSGQLGGAISSGDGTITGSTFDSNTASWGGGAIWGGGALHIANSSFNANTDSADPNGGVASFGGGAIAVDSGPQESSPTVTDSTFTGNLALQGGAVAVVGGDLGISSSTFSDNTAQRFGGAILDTGASADSLTLASSTLTGNSDGDGPNDLSEADGGNATVNVAADVFSDGCEVPSGKLDDDGYNVSASSTCLGTAPVSQPDAAVGSDAGDLGSPADNGGPTQTIELGTGNPAIDLIPNSTSFTVPDGSGTMTIACPVMTDQRGDSNPGVNGCDAGATQYAQQAVPDTNIPPTQDGSSVALGIHGLAGLPTTYAVDPSTPGFGTSEQACTYDGTFFFHMVHVGSCAIDVTEPGNVNFQSATGTTSISIIQGAQTVSFSSAAPTDAVVGGSAYKPAADSSRGQAVTIEVDAATTNDACSYDATSGLVSFDHAGSCVIDAVQAGGGDYTAAQQQQTFVVAQAETTTSLSVKASQLSATVTPQAPGGGAPTGKVSFSVDGRSVGSASLVNGVAELDYAVATNKSHQVSAAYAGDADYASSSDSTARNNPSITAKLTSSRPKSAASWWRSTVTIRFSCQADGSPLVVACPKPVTLSKSGAAQSVTESVAAANGGAATITVAPINIDLTRPTVKIVGPRNGEVYRGSVPKAVCVAADRFSGIKSCKITKHAKHTAGVEAVTYTATATSESGATAETTISVKLRTKRVIPGR